MLHYNLPNASVAERKQALTAFRDLLGAGNLDRRMQTGEFRDHYNLVRNGVRWYIGVEASRDCVCVVCQRDGWWRAAMLHDTCEERFSGYFSYPKQITNRMSRMTAFIAEGPLLDDTTEFTLASSYKQSPRVPGQKLT